MTQRLANPRGPLNGTTHPAARRRPRFPDGQAKYLLCAAPDDMREWRQRADTLGLSFAEFVRSAVRFQCSLPVTGIPSVAALVRRAGPVLREPIDTLVVAPESTAPVRTVRGPLRKPVTLRNIEA